VAELKALWEPAAEAKLHRWSQVRPSWPDTPISLYGAGLDSGTYDYFTQAVVGTAQLSRKDYTASEDDYLLAQDLATDPSGLGFFGYAQLRNPMKTILVVDDNHDNRTIIAQMLKISGYHAICATDGLHALDMAASERPDLILMDMAAEARWLERHGPPEGQPRPGPRAGDRPDRPRHPRRYRASDHCRLRRRSRQADRLRGDDPQGANLYGRVTALRASSAPVAARG
jgi:hypothetical protein